LIKLYISDLTLIAGLKNELKSALEFSPYRYYLIYFFHSEQNSDHSEHSISAILVFLLIWVSLRLFVNFNESNPIMSFYGLYPCFSSNVFIALPGYILDFKFLLIYFQNAILKQWIQTDSDVLWMCCSKMNI